MVARISAKLASALGAAREELPSEPKRSKFGAKKTVVDGVSFDSQGEATRWSQLRILQRAGEISDLERQVEYPLSVGGVIIGKIRPDFRYRRAGALVVEDFKSKPTMTDIFRWKAKHLLAEHGIKLEIVQ